MNVIAVVNPKGGTSKTTTSAHLAHALADRGHSVLAVDADGENESLLRWSDLAADDWGVETIALPSANLHQRLPALTRGRYDDVVIDTPPMDIAGGVITSSLRAATHVVIPCAPTTMDIDRIGAILDMLDDVSSLRDAHPPVVAVLLSQVVTSAASGDVFAEVIIEMGVPVLRTRIPRLERFAQAFGRAVTTGIYRDVADELLALAVTFDPGAHL